MPTLEKYVQSLEKVIDDFPKKAEEMVREKIEPVVLEQARSYAPGSIPNTIQSKITRSKDSIDLDITAGTGETPAVRAHEEPQTTDSKRGPKFLSRAVRDSRAEIQVHTQEMLHNIFKQKRKQPNLLEKRTVNTRVQ